VPAGALTEHGWKSKPKFKDGVAAQVVFDVDEHHEAPVARPCIALILGVCRHRSHRVVADIAMPPSGV